MGRLTMTLEIETYEFRDDGLIPNNERLPLVLYRSALTAPSGQSLEQAFQQRFAANGWCGTWVNGIYDFQHYHAHCHEVLGIGAGEADVQFGGPSGPVLQVKAGDAVVIPAGVGHCRRDSRPGLIVVGAYPAGQQNVDLKRANAADRAASLEIIPQVALPEQDPIAGSGQGLPLLWT